MRGNYVIDHLRGEPRLVEDILEWARWYEGADRQLADDTLEGGTRVSTVFLGMDHNFGCGPPVLYETMVFGGPHDGWCDRYADWKIALDCHHHLVGRLRGGLLPEGE